MGKKIRDNPSATVVVLRTVMKMRKNEIRIIKNEYNEILKALHVAETDYSANKRSVRKRAECEFIAAQEQVVYNLCLKLGIVLEDENT